MERKGLEGKFNANPGDIVRLKGTDIGTGNISTEIEASGYVILISPFKVRLSHENPFKASIRVFSGNRDYKLSCFNSYDVLK